jgi:hypothetical protein
LIFSSINAEADSTGPGLFMYTSNSRSKNRGGVRGWTDTSSLPAQRRPKQPAVRGNGVRYGFRRFPSPRAPWKRYLTPFPS